MDEIDLPGLEMALLCNLMGDWIAAPPLFDGVWTCVIRRGPGGLCLIVNEAGGESDAVSRHGLLTWDAMRECFLYAVADSRVAGIVLLEGGWEASALVLEGSGTARPHAWRRIVFSDITERSFRVFAQGADRFGRPRASERVWKRRGGA